MAVPPPADWCTTDPTGVLPGERCFKTLKEAEALMKLEPSPATGREHLEPSEPIPSPYFLTGDTIRIDYIVRDRAPQTRGPEYHYAVENTYVQCGLKEVANCGSPSVRSTCNYDNPLTDRCGDEAAVTQNIINHYASNHCNVSAASLSNYAEPPNYSNIWVGSWGGGTAETGRFSYSDYPSYPTTPGGQYVNFTEFTYEQCSAPFTQYSQVWRFYQDERYDCPEHFVPMVGRINDLGGLQTQHIKDYPQVCKNSETGLITGRLKQFDQCSEANPCHPLSGSKSQSEKDFEFGGLSFQRHYQSARQVQVGAGLGFTWGHTFASRMQVHYSVKNSVSKFYSIDERLNVDQHEIATAPLWKSVNDTESVVRRFDSGGNFYDGHVHMRPNGEHRTYNYDGQLSKITWVDRPGEELVLSYDVNDRLELVVDSQGRELWFNYGAINEGATCYQDMVTFDEWRACGSIRLTRIDLPDGTDVDYSYDVYGNLIRVDYADSTFKEYHYENAAFPHHLTGITDEKAIRYGTYGYDAWGRVTLSEHPGGAGRATLDYITDDEIEVTLPLGDVRTYETNDDVFRNPSDVTDGRGVKSSLYDSEVRLTIKEDRQGNETRYAYADELRRTEVTHAYGTGDERTLETDWDYNINRPLERRTVKSAVIKQVETLTYGSEGEMLTRTQTDPATSANRTSTYTYLQSPDVNEGRLSMIDGPRTGVTDVTTYEYYESNQVGGDYRVGDLKRVTNGVGHQTNYLKYDSAGRLLEMTDPNGVLTVNSYHPRGWLISRSVGGETTTYTYELTGKVSRVTQADGGFVEYGYDDAHRMISIEDSQGNRIDYTLDAAGNHTAEVVKDDQGTLVRQLSRVYNSLDQLEKTVDAYSAETIFEYDNSSNRIESVDPLARDTDYQYDPLDRLEKTIEPLVTGESTRGEVEYAYDDRDNLISVTDTLGNVTTYTYNGLDDLTQLVSPDTGTTTYTYDAAGNRDTLVDARGITTTYTYDALNRLTDIQYPTSSLDVVFTYDAGTYGKGRLTGMTDSTGSTSWIYDDQGRVTNKTQISSGVTLSISYGYDAQGRMTSMTYPSGSVLTYTYDTTSPNEIESMSWDGQLILSNLEYEPFGRPSSWTWGNGTAHTYNYDQNGRISSHSLAGDTRNIGYDAKGNILSLLDGYLDADYTYDELDRLKTADTTWGSGGTTTESLFAAPPAVLAHIQTTNNETAAIPGSGSTPFMTAAMRNVATGSVQLALGRAEVAAGSVSTDETIGYLAIEAGASGSFSANSNTIDFEAQVTADTIRGWANGCYTTNFANTYPSNPVVIASQSRHDGGDGGWLRRCSLSTSAVGLTVDEDQYRDSERAHTTEAASLIAFSQSFDTQFTTNGETWAMEAGTAALPATMGSSTFQTVSLQQSYGSAPVVIALATNEDTQPSAVYIDNVTTTSFDIAQIEPPNLDGPHGAMTVHYIVIEQGVHLLPDGTRLEANTTSSNNVQHGSGVTGSESWATVTFNDITLNSGSGIQTLDQAFAYDLNGNRTQLTENGTSYVYQIAASSNRLLSSAGPSPKSFTHDAAGNVTADGTHTYEIDDHGRIAAVDNSLTAEYSVDGQGRRLKKTAGATTLYAYSDTGHLIGEYSAVGSALREHVFLAGKPVMVDQSSSPHFVHTDHLGSPRAVTSSTGAVEWRWDGSPFGATDPDEDVDGNGNDIELGLRFPGQLYDEETGHHYNGWRDYDPGRGRYTQSDPIGLNGGMNPFSYSVQRPTAAYDFDGRQATLAWCAGGPLGCAAGAGVALVCIIRGVRGTQDALSGRQGSFAMSTSTPAPGPGCRPDSGGADNCDDDNECDRIRKRDEANCFENYAFLGYDHDVFQGCMSRAAWRWSMCNSNGGSMPPDAPGPWSDADWDGWPTIHD